MRCAAREHGNWCSNEDILYSMTGVGPGFLPHHQGGDEAICTDGDFTCGRFVRTSKINHKNYFHSDPYASATNSSGSILKKHMNRGAQIVTCFLMIGIRTMSVSDRLHRARWNAAGMASRLF